MDYVEEIQRNVEQLPTPMQVEVLRFIELLSSKAERGADHEWSIFSLAGAMQGLESEQHNEYSLEDLKITFK